MRYLTAVLCALALAACATPADPPQLAATGATGIIAAATLAEWGTVEMSLAPAYTRNAIARQRAARALGTGKISADTARQILAATDAARTALDAGRTTPADLAAHLATAAAATDHAEQLLEPTQ